MISCLHVFLSVAQEDQYGRPSVGKARAELIKLKLKGTVG